MNVVIDQSRCPVITAAVEPIVLHPRYHALRVREVDPDVGLYALTPITGIDRALHSCDGAAEITVTWIGDVMEQVRLKTGSL